MADIEFCDVADLFDYWRDFPPVHEMIAAYLGVKPRAKIPDFTPTADDPSGIGDLIRGGGIGGSF